MLKKATSRNVIWAVSAICFLGILASVWWHLTARPQFDALLQAAFAHATQTTSYAQYVETEQVSEEGALHIVGDYLVDNTGQRFASYSTTTLSRAGNPPVIFELANISVGSNVYLRLTNRTPKYKLSIPATGTWQQFPADAIPSMYENIAIAGPVLDDLRLVDDGGVYLSLVKNEGLARLGKEQFIHYIFRLSRLAETARDAVVRSIADRVGPTGVVDLWINASSTSIASMRLTDGSTYTSTTTFSRLNEPLGISTPAIAPMR